MVEYFVFRQLTDRRQALNKKLCQGAEKYGSLDPLLGQIAMHNYANYGTDAFCTLMS